MAETNLDHFYAYANTLCGKVHEIYKSFCYPCQTVLISPFAKRRLLGLAHHLTNVAAITITTSFR
jgi:hypothetical protein